MDHIYVWDKDPRTMDAPALSSFLSSLQLEWTWKSFLTLYLAVFHQDFPNAHCPQRNPNAQKGCSLNLFKRLKLVVRILPKHDHGIALSTFLEWPSVLHKLCETGQETQKMWLYGFSQKHREDMFIPALCLFMFFQVGVEVTKLLPNCYHSVGISKIAIEDFNSRLRRGSGADQIQGWRPPETTALPGTEALPRLDVLLGMCTSVCICICPCRFVAGTHICIYI